MKLNKIFALMLAIVVFATAMPVAYAGSSTDLIELLPDYTEFFRETADLHEKRMKNENNSELDAAQAVLEKMTVDELNAYIDARVEEVKAEYLKWKTKRETADLRLVYNALQLAWISAGNVMIAQGYPCIGTMILYSVRGENYVENNMTSGSTNGLFYKKINKTNAFYTFKSQLYQGIIQPGVAHPVTHPRSENADLHFSLNQAYYTAFVSGSRYRISVHDEYSFEWWREGEFISQFVNNVGVLFQAVGVLRDIDIDISFSIAKPNVTPNSTGLTSAV